MLQAAVLRRGVALCVRMQQSTARQQLCTRPSWNLTASMSPQPACLPSGSRMFGCYWRQQGGWASKTCTSNKGSALRPTLRRGGVGRRVMAVAQQQQQQQQRGSTSSSGGQPGHMAPPLPQATDPLPSTVAQVAQATPRHMALVKAPLSWLHHVLSAVSACWSSWAQGAVRWAVGAATLAAVMALSPPALADSLPPPQATPHEHGSPQVGVDAAVMQGSTARSAGSAQGSVRVAEASAAADDGTGSSGWRPVFLDKPRAGPTPDQQKESLQKLKAPTPSVGELSPDELATVNLFLEASPSVVNIANIATATNTLTMDVLRIPQGTGSGFVWDNNGHIVTNWHVVRGASEVQVALVDQEVYKAKLVGADPDKDTAVLKLDIPASKAKDLKAVTLGSSSGLFVGQKVYALGNPFGLDHTLTQGIISGLNRELDTGTRGPIRDVIQTDAAINPGNSGGVLLDSKGRLIGINTAIADPTGRGASSGVGFAIPIDTVKPLVEQILTHGRVIRPVLGVTIAPPQTLRQLNLEGVLVVEVPPGSPAAKAGVLPTKRDQMGRLVLGDVIIGLAGQPVKGQQDLFKALDECNVGETIKVEVLREGKPKTLSITLGERGVAVGGTVSRG